MQIETQTLFTQPTKEGDVNEMHFPLHSTKTVVIKDLY